MTKSANLLIALSAGGKDNELAAVGIGMEHVDELMVRIARKLLRDGHLLAFGGTLGATDQPLTQSLIDAALGWLDSESAKMADVTRPETWPLVNHSAWPVYNYISQEQRAKLVSVCNFIDIKPSGVSEAELVEGFENWAAKPKSRLLFANALTEMREQSALATDLRIVWAGTIWRAKGWMAGILEEVMASLRHHKPVVVFGGFGGCAGLLADFLKDPTASWPKALATKASADEDRDALLSTQETLELKARFDEGKALIEDYRQALYASEHFHGVSCDLLKDALAEGSTRNAIGIAAKAAVQRSANRS